MLSQTEARKLLAQSGLQAEDMEKKVKNLSGGERAKLELALLQAKHGNVLFLDEPTNHLDLPAREALEEALCRFDGTLLFVSHDRYFIRAVATQVACIENRSLTLFDGDYESFLSDRNQKNTEEKPAPTKIKTSETGGYRSKEERAQEAKRKTRIKEVEKALEQLETEESQLNAQLTEYAADFSKIQALCKRLEEIHAQTDLLYREYETLID